MMISVLDDTFEGLRASLAEEGIPAEFAAKAWNQYPADESASAFYRKGLMMAAARRMAREARI